MPKPSIDEFALYAVKVGLPENEAHRCYDYYEAVGWKVGRNPMKCWQAAVRYWFRTWRSRVGPKAISQNEPEWAKEKRLKAELEALRARLFKIGDVSPIHSHEQAAAIRAARAPICERINAVKQDLNII